MFPSISPSGLYISVPFSSTFLISLSLFLLWLLLRFTTILFSICISSCPLWIICYFCSSFLLSCSCPFPAVLTYPPCVPSCYFLSLVGFTFLSYLPVLFPTSYSLPPVSVLLPECYPAYSSPSQKNWQLFMGLNWFGVLGSKKCWCLLLWRVFKVQEKLFSCLMLLFPDMWMLDQGLYAPLGSCRSIFN